VRFSGVLQHAKLEMVLQSSSGLTFGTVTYYKTNPRRYSPLQKTKKILVAQFLTNNRIEEQRSSSTYLSQSQLFRNIRRCKKLFNKSKFQILTKILGIAFGETVNTHLQSFITPATKTYILQLLLCGYRILNAQTK
jgi:hypothetical protein